MRSRRRSSAQGSRGAACYSAGTGMGSREEHNKDNSWSRCRGTEGPTKDHIRTESHNTSKAQNQIRCGIPIRNRTDNAGNSPHRRHASRNSFHAHHRTRRNDHKLMESMARMPSSMKLHGSSGKHLTNELRVLRATCRGTSVLPPVLAPTHQRCRTSSSASRPFAEISLSISFSSQRFLRKLCPILCVTSRVHSIGRARDSVTFDSSGLWLRDAAWASQPCSRNITRCFQGEDFEH